MLRTNDATDDDDDDDDDDMLVQALPVAEDGDCDQRDPAAPPATGAEYLRMVRDEARRLPKVVVARDALPAYHASRADPVPKDAWRGLAAHFDHTRQILRRAQRQQPKAAAASAAVPALTDRAGWRTYFSSPLQTPRVSVVAAWPQELVLVLLAYHVDWLMNGTALSQHMARWIFCLLVLLDRDGPHDSSTLLRHLALQCAPSQRVDVRSADADPQINAAATVIVAVLRDNFNISLPDSS